MQPRMRTLLLFLFFFLPFDHAKWFSLVVAPPSLSFPASMLQGRLDDLRGIGIAGTGLNYVKHVAF